MRNFFKGKRGGPVLQRLKNQDYSSPEERADLLQELESNPGLSLDEIAWMVLARDAGIRASGVRIIKKNQYPNVVDYFVRRWADLGPVGRQTVSRTLPEVAPPGWESTIVNLLAHRSERNRQIGEELALSSPLTDEFVEALLPKLEKITEKLKRRLLGRLADSNDPRLGPLFEEYLEDEDEELRVAAVKALAVRRDPKYVGRFAARLDVETFAVQQEIVNAFVGYAETGMDITTQVLPLMSGGSVAVRQAAMNILTQMPDQKRVVREFLSYSKTLAGWVRRRAIDSMLEFSNLLQEPLLELLRDSDPSVRSAAIRVAASIKADERVEKALIALVRDEDWWVRVNAIETLGELKSKNALSVLVKLLDDPDTRWSAIEALVRVGDVRVAPYLLRYLKDEQTEIRVEVIKALGTLKAKDALSALKDMCESDAHAEVRTEAYRAVMEIAEANELKVEKEAEKLKRKVDLHVEGDVREQPALVQILLRARSEGASDVHISVDSNALMRVKGELVPIDTRHVLTPKQTLRLLQPILDEGQKIALEQDRSVELCYEVPEMGRYRGSIFLDRKGLNGIFRLIPTKVPTISEIGLPAHLGAISTWHQGLVLIVGPAGSGKTTTLAALVDLFNETRRAHILTVEDPIEYVHSYKNCLVNQRQIGRDTQDYHRALRGALREDPDVIVLGEMRDSETVRMALEAAETGHLVIGTINGTSAPRAIDRLINSFSPSEQSQVRMMLSDTIKVVIAQALLPRKDGSGRTALFEVLMGLSTVGAVIRENKLFMLESLMQTGKRLGMKTFDDALIELVEKNLITPEVGYMRARKKEGFEAMVSAEFLEGVLA